MMIRSLCTQAFLLLFAGASGQMVASLCVTHDPVVGLACHSDTDVLSSKEDPMSDRNDPLPERPGIYYRDEQGGWTELLPTLTSHLRLKGLWGTVFSFGIAHTRTLALLSGERSANRFTHPPVFRFRFDPDNPSFGNSGNVYTGFIASSPTEFALARLEMRPKKAAGRFQMGRFNITRMEMGVPMEQRIPFQTTRLGPDLFEVTFQDTVPGEFGWVLLTDGMSSTAPVRVYDFGTGP